MKTSKNFCAALLAALTLVVAGCSTSRKLDSIASQSLSAELSIPAERPIQRATPEPVPDSHIDGQPYVMDAVRDSVSGDMVATERLQAAVLFARFRNVAERCGVVDMEFMIAVSDSLQDPRWQLRFTPIAIVQEDSLVLESVLLTGEDFRRSQLKGYEKYSRYLRGLSRDSTLFVDRNQAQLFMERGYAIDMGEVERHYSRDYMRRLNRRRLSRKEAVKQRCIPTPISPEYARFDSLVSSTHPFIYIYKFSLPTRPGLRKIDVVVDGAIYDEKKELMSLPQSEAISYYVSSLSTLCDASLAPPSDTLYHKALEMIRDRQYESALTILTPYKDYNTALAYLALDYNATAALILENLPETAAVDYMLALSYSRRGNEKDALSRLIRAVEAEPQYKYRGNLDPEIAAIIRKYNLFQD